MASFSAAASPTIVSTERLCDASDERSSRRTPGVLRTAATSCSTTSGRRPSLRLGTDSMMAIGDFYHVAALTFTSLLVARLTACRGDQILCAPARPIPASADSLRGK